VIATPFTRSSNLVQPDEVFCCPRVPETRCSKPRFQIVSNNYHVLRDENALFTRKLSIDENLFELFRNFIIIG
jgi:hypothetical protein